MSTPFDTRIRPRLEHLVMARQLGLNEHRPSPPKPSDPRMERIDVNRLAAVAATRKLI